MQSTAFDPYGLPKELYRLPQPFIYMTGLHINSQKAHQLIWESFSLNRRSDRIPLNFKLLPDDTEFPTIKQKHQSYEFYIPKGILKSTWISKHLEEIPSLIVLFWQLDWNDANWLEKKSQIAERIQMLKSKTSNMNTRLAVVLIQNMSGPTLVGDESSMASEKAATLCASCDLPPKHLFVLPHSDTHLLGYTIRLENALCEIAGGYYLAEMKGVKAHKDFLNKTNHQLLFVRHHFKIAFHNEMKNDPQPAVKYYGQCYHLLLEHRFTNTNLHEIRIVAAIINYKICKLDFALNLPRDAIEQFRRHIDVFRQRTGSNELIFEHYAWLSRQYQIFGELFEEAVKDGLPAVQTQHPGFYYQQAAHYAILRKKTALEICTDIEAPTSDLLQGWESLEFYGQRPWRPGKHCLEPPEPELENQGTQAICFYEANRVAYSSISIPLFSLAVAQFKKYRCPRIKRYLMVQMAGEYNDAQDPSKALTLLNHVMWDYRSERWWPLLSSCSTSALSCAFQTTALQEYVTLSLEIMGPQIMASVQQKKLAYLNFLRVLNLQPPLPPEGLSDAAVSSALDSWSFALQSKMFVAVNMDDIFSCLEVRTGFLKDSTPVDAAVDITVIVRNCFSESFQLFYIIILLDSSSTPQLNKTHSSALLLNPRDLIKTNFVFQPSIEDTNKTIKVTGITLGVGTSPEKVMALQWSGSGLHLWGTSYSQEFKPLLPSPFGSSELHLSINITTRSPKIGAQIIYDASAMVWEWLPVRVSVLNSEKSTITDVLLSMELESGSTDINLERTTQMSTSSSLDNKFGVSSISNFALPNLLPDGNEETIIYVKAITASSRTFTMKISYKCEIEFNGKIVDCETVFTSNFSIHLKIPFEIDVETQSVKFSPLRRIATREKFLVVPRIKCTSHVPIEFTGSSIVPSNHIKLEGESVSQVGGAKLEEGEEATDCFCVSVTQTSPVVPLGQYLLYWKRHSVNSPVVSVSIGLPSVTVEDLGIWVDANIPSHGTVRVPMTIAYDLTNTCDRVQELLVSMCVSDAFMFSGPREVKLRILPQWRECISFTLFPLLAGYVQLPRVCVALDVVSPPYTSSDVDDFICRILPSHLFVMPKEKGQ